MALCETFLQVQKFSMEMKSFRAPRFFSMRMAPLPASPISFVTNSCWTREAGGFDLDTICLKPFDFPQEYVFSSEMHHGTPVVDSAVIKVPQGSEFCAHAWRVCLSKDPKNLIWGRDRPTARRGYG